MLRNIARSRYLAAVRGLLFVAAYATSPVFGQDVASQQAAWEKMVEARHDALVKQWGTGTDPQLRGQLETMYSRDQGARKFMMTLPQDQWTEALVKYQWDEDAALTSQLKSIVSARGWPTFRMVGVDASGYAMLILNHSADHAWKNDMLPRLEKLAEHGEIDSSDLAMTIDKALIAAGKRQRYGTNFKFVGSKMQMFAVEDPEHLAERRKQAMLPPMALYKHQLAQVYHSRVIDEIAQPEPLKP